MAANEQNNNWGRTKSTTMSGNTINLQGVAAFVGLVELLATELGTTPGRIQGMLPNGPTSFEELVGEIVYNSQGFQRSITLMAKPGCPLKMHFQSSWTDNFDQESGAATKNGVECLFCLSATVEEILPQGRALARYCEDEFALLDGMVTIGQSRKLSSMSVSVSEMQAFEQNNAGNLVTNFSPKKSSVSDL